MRRVSTILLFLLISGVSIPAFAQPAPGLTGDKADPPASAGTDEALAFLNNTDAVRSISSFAMLQNPLGDRFRATLTDSGVSCKNAKTVVGDYLADQFGANGPEFAIPGKGKDRFHAIVHVYAMPSAARPSPGEGCWFVGKQTAPGKFEVSTEARIQGSTNVAIAAILLGLSPGLTSEAISTSYWTLVKSKLPQNLKNLFDAFRLPTIAAEGTKDAVYHGFAPILDVTVPSDISVVPVRGKGDKRKPLVSKPFVVDNEGRHLWDVSVGVPVTKATGLEYVENTSSFTAKEVNKQTLMAMFNFIPVGCAKGKGCNLGGDLKNNKEFRPLSLLAGIGVTGKPGDRFFLGAGVGIGIAQVFAGSGFNNVEYKDPANGQLVRTHYRSRLVFGVNIPVGNAISKLTKK